MAFGLFKKHEIADSIFMNSKIFTQDPDFPWADAVACKNGLILGVGEYEGMEELADSNTEIIDLAGQFMFPGFINAHGLPVLKTFAGKYLAIDEDWNFEKILNEVKEYAETNENKEVIFGYGYNENVLTPHIEDDDDSKLRVMLDDIVPDRPMLLLGASCSHFQTNTYAKNLIAKTAEDEVINFITLPYILNLLVPFDFDEIEAATNEISAAYCDHGFTSIFNLYSPDYFDSLYQDSILGLENEGRLSQRYFGSLFTNRPINPHTLIYTLMDRKTACLEIGHSMAYNFLKLVISSKNDSSYFSEEALNTILLAVSDKGFNIHVDALDLESLIKVYKGFDLIRNSGYNKNILVCASNVGIDPESRKNFLCYDEVIRTWETDIFSDSITNHVENTLDAITNVTTKAAEIIGMASSLGSIEKGKLADFTIFEQNPLDCNLNNFSKLHSSMTVIGGQIIYDKEKEDMDEMYDLLSSQQL